MGHAITIDGETAPVGTAAELVVVLNVLQGQHDRTVLEQLAPNLAEIIDGPQGLHSALSILTPEDQAYLIETLGSRLVDCIQNSRALRDILATLAEGAVEESLLRTLGQEGLQHLLATPETLAQVLEWVYGSRDRLALELLGPEFPRGLFRTGRELSLVLKALNAESQDFVLDEIGWESVPPLVQDDMDLAYLLRALPTALSKELLGHFTREQLMTILRGGRDYAGIRRYLEAGELAHLDALMGVNIDAE